MEKIEVIEAIELIRKYNTETNKIETKTALGGFPKKCYDTFSSFSNKYGGLIIFGINENENFKTEGVYNINDLQKQITSLCNDSMEPAIRCDILPLEFEEKNILAVKIEEIIPNKKPCYYKPKGLKNGSYTREGDRDELMSDYEIYALQSYNDHIIEDKRPNKNSSIDDLKIEELNKYIEKVKINKPNFSKHSFEKSLRLCGIIDNIENKIIPTLAGTLIFGEYPQSYFPQLFVACAVIPGQNLGDVSELDERFLDNKRVEGTIEEMLEETMNFLRRNMKTRIIINSNGERINETEYPLKALREAVANALIHRDYSFQTENAYVSVYMYDDRIEIINPGALYGTNKIEKLGSSTIMETRNPNIVRILEEKSSVIENRHSGIPTMKREMKKYNLPNPEFYEERGSFKVIFRNIPKDFIQQTWTTNITNKRGQQTWTTNVDNKCGQQMWTTNVDNKQGKLAEYKNLVLIFCENPKSAKEISEFLNIKSRQYISSNIIKPLINEGKLNYTNRNSVNAKNQKYITNKEI